MPLDSSCDLLYLVNWSKLLIDQVGMMAVDPKKTKRWLVFPSVSQVFCIIYAVHECEPHAPVIIMQFLPASYVVFLT